MGLRDYQLEAVEAAWEGRRGIVVAPTGSGKSLMISELCRRYLEAGRDVCVVVNEVTVKGQLREHGVPAEIIFSPMSAPIEADTVVIIDEVHHFRDDRAWGRCLEADCVIGFSATPVWKSLPILYTIPYWKLRRDGWLAAPLCGVFCTKQSEVDAAVSGRKAVFYIPSKDKYESWMGRLITAETPVCDREFKPGESRLCNIATLTTGWDNKDIDTVVLCRRIGEAQTYVQIIGRLRRGGVVVDMSDNILRFGLDEDALIATLGNKIAGKEGTGIPILNRCLACDRLVSPRLKLCPYCGTELPINPTTGKLWEKTSIDAWLKCFKNLGWQKNKMCPYTNSGVWPVKFPNGAEGYFGMNTAFFWEQVRRKLEEAKNGSAEVEFFTIAKTWWIIAFRPGSPMYYIDLSWGSDLKWRSPSL